MVVVGVDFSAGANDALDAGRQLAAQTGTLVCPVHVVREGSGSWQPAEDEFHWLALQELKPADVRVRRGEPWVELVKVAEELGATLVVTGTHGESGFQPFRLGTTAANVALRCRTPVVLVPPNTSMNLKSHEVRHEEIP